MSHNPCNEEFMIICGLKVRWEVEGEKRGFKRAAWMVFRMFAGSYEFSRLWRTLITCFALACLVTIVMAVLVG